MAGTIIPLISKRPFDFAGTQSGLAIELTYIKTLDVSAYTEGTLNVRVHTVDIDHASSNIKVQATGSTPSPDDPGEEFVESTALGTCTLSSSAAAGDLVTAGLDLEDIAYLQISVSGTRASLGTNVSADISAELVAKE